MQQHHHHRRKHVHTHKHTHGSTVANPSLGGREVVEGGNTKKKRLKEPRDRQESMGSNWDREETGRNVFTGERGEKERKGEWYCVGYDECVVRV